MHKGVPPLLSALSTAMLAAALFTTTPAIAQSDSSEMSVEELQERFLKQKTRGLRIVPRANAPAAATGGGTTVTAPATTANTTTPTPTEPVVAPVAYTPLEEVEQVFVNIRFDFDSAALREDQKSKLVTLCDAMKAVDVSQFRIVGHTDASGTAEYNERLSLLRAQEVKRYFVGSCGIPAERLETMGVGERHPLTGTEPRAGETRRVDFQALS